MYPKGMAVQPQEFARFFVQDGEGARDGGADAAQGVTMTDTWLRIIVAIGEIGEPPTQARH
jgi:hypothetical protein